MSHGGGGTAQQPSCTAMPLGKTVRRALRAAIGMPKPKKRNKKKKPTTKDDDDLVAAPGGSTELISSFSKEAAGAATRRESVVRVVLSSGVVEVYPGVVLACTVIRKHPPGLCLAHPDVFRNPHGAVVRPLEPLFPGQKFLLIPWTTVDKLKQRIPESSIGAFADEDRYGAAVDDEDEGEEDTGSEEAATSSSTETEEEEAAAGDGGSFMPACSAREYFLARDRWSECHFQKLVEQGLAVEPSTDDDQPRKDKDKARHRGKKKRKAKGNKKRRERRPAAPLPGLRAFATPRRAWEPSLPSVVEEENNAVSPLQSPATASNGGGLQKRCS